MSQVLYAIWVLSLTDHKFRFQNIVLIHFSETLSHYNPCPWFRTIYHGII